MLVLHIQGAGELTICTREGNYKALGQRRIALGKKAFHGLFASTGNLIVGNKSSVQEKPQITGSADNLSGLCDG